MLSEHTVNKHLAKVNTSLTSESKSF